MDLQGALQVPHQSVHQVEFALAKFSAVGPLADAEEGGDRPLGANDSGDAADDPEAPAEML